MGSKFLWSGKGPSGQEEVEEVYGETPEEARRVLEKRGWTELRQHNTDMHDFVVRQIRESEKPDECDCDDDPPLTPREHLQYHQGTAPGMWSHWLADLRGSVKFILVLLLCMALALFVGKLTVAKEIWIGFLAVVVLFTVFLYPVLRWRSGRTKRAFVKLSLARTWHRWDEVLRCLDELAASKESTNIVIGDYEMDRYRALALTGQGRLEVGLNLYRAAAEKARTPEWLAHASEAVMFVTARQFDRALESYRAALEAAVDKSIVCLDMGALLVQRFNQPEEAKQLLAQAQKMQLSELARIHVPMLRGAIAFREGDFRTMDKGMREALAGFEERAVPKKAYLFEGSILMCKGYLAVSSAALGKKDEARRFFAEAGEYLKVIELTDLVRQYEVSMGKG
jgi:tetratricopeptide (TPR) repeat protein